VNSTTPKLEPADGHLSHCEKAWQSARNGTPKLFTYSHVPFGLFLSGTVVICWFQSCVCRFHLECEMTVGNIVVWWMDQQWGIAVTFWNRPHGYDWTEWRSWWCVWTNCFQTFGNSNKECQHTAAVDKDHLALPIHHCQSMKTYMPILGSYPFWDSGSFATSETVAKTKTEKLRDDSARVNQPPWLHQLTVLSTGWAVFFICLFTLH
jgi:hypothetical protein